jgi:hypothetical protein
MPHILTYLLPQPVNVQLKLFKAPETDDKAVGELLITIGAFVSPKSPIKGLVSDRIQ